MEKGERKKKTWILLAALIVIQRFSAWTVDAVMEGLTGIEPAEGMPKTAWIGMGLQETGGAPGVWNGYSVSLYEENGYDYDKTNEAAKEKIMDQILIFLDDRSYGVDFSEERMRRNGTTLLLAVCRWWMEGKRMVKRNWTTCVMAL